MGLWNSKTLNQVRLVEVGRWTDGLWVCGLAIAALLIFTISLGEVPLRDWDEGIVAQVARDIWRSQTHQSPDSLTWLYPTLGGVPYLNKPTLVHWLIAQCYALGGVNEWMARLPGALLSALSVPLLYCLCRELFPRRTPAVLAALIYLTLLPVARHGRLAMLDGALVFFCLVMMYCLLRSRRDLRWGLGVGMGFGLMCLTKGAVGILLGAIALVFLYWDTPRLLTSGYLWWGMGLGSVPILGWYGAQWATYGASFLGVNLVSQSFSRVWASVEGNQGPIWYYLLEILKYTLPWLVFLPQGFKLAWEHRTLSWAKLVLVWSGGYLAVISLMQTKLPWYVMPLYPPLAIAAGAMLASVWEPGDVTGLRRLPQKAYPRAWKVIFGILAIAAWGMSLYFGKFATPTQPDLTFIGIAIALTLTAATILIGLQDSQFILILIWGCYLSLMMLMMSPHWLWELAESYPAKPVAALIQSQTPPKTIVQIASSESRPSLNFYSDRWVVPVTSNTAIIKYWQETLNPYLLIDRPTLSHLSLPSMQELGSAEGWVLLTKAHTSANKPSANKTGANKQNSLEANQSVEPKTALTD